MTKPLAEAGGVNVSVDDVFLFMKTGDAGALREVLRRKIAAAKALAMGLSVPEESVDDALSTRYGDLDLFEPAQVSAWLKNMKIDESALRDQLREELLVERLRTVLVPDSSVRERYNASPYDYATLHVQKIAFESQGAAAETLLQLNEGELSWEDAIAQSGALESLVYHRKDAPEDSAALLLVAPLGGFVGPAEDDVGYAIYRIIWRVEPKLDEDLREEIRAAMFDEEIDSLIAKQPLRYLR